MFNKEKAFNEYFQKMQKIIELTNNPVQLMKEYLKLQDWFESIYQSGFADGFKEGKQKAINEISKQN
jgi:hypothetical protein